MKAITEGVLLWKPSQQQIENSGISLFMKWLKKEKGLSFGSQNELWKWSVEELETFWENIWNYCQVKSNTSYNQVLESRLMPGVKWFTGSTLNYAEHVFRNIRGNKPAVIFQSETTRRTELSWKELYEKTAMVANSLKELGVKPGDRVVAYMPNIPETVIAFLACASIGAIWSSCSPDFGTNTVIDRFKQIEPTILFAVDGYSYNGKIQNRKTSVSEIQLSLPTLKKTILIPYVSSNDSELNHRTMYWNDLLQGDCELVFEKVPFDHPLWILFSSGTTGLPKPIVQSQGGILLEQLKTLLVEQGVNRDDVFFWFTTTGWMMWNLLVGGLLTGGTIVLYDGSPSYPSIHVLWDIAEEVGVTFFGTSAGFLSACMKFGVKPKESRKFSELKAICSTGSPLPVEGFVWVYENVKTDVWLVSTSGGTDVCTAFVGGSPILPVYAGEIQARALGAHVQAFDDEGKSITNEVGELVITAPMPSMPIYFWGDNNNKRYLESYFEMYPGIWRHGDWIKFDDKGSCIIFGRSDSTINRLGVRIGTSEIYRVVESLDDIMESLVVDLELLGRKSCMLIFVVLKPGVNMSDELKETIKAEIKEKVSPRFVPDEVYEVEQIPKTLSGKKLEVPIRKILLGFPPEKVVNQGSMANPESLNFFIELARIMNEQG
ncbi:acetoacetate--CoA ligase [Bacillus pseudomycoides]|uniref:Acetoacetate--CoA ligase n=1 Tax=Bacillus pseudomycoides TaxID=64104 RepID=A0AA91VAC5_9BACI|nr:MULTISPECIES: acetoacetate--CoA ligase [Bacillus]PEB51748.1 acetoacetate--CoA ligase [Bacillus sp. AFS098217]PED80780.1 acetoacetate--CoA ligase [Bacillus pseudomycoides]PEU11935.1 acetoacetate--CoA ligase [Bacillus sp. AFS019443]PEU14467.1 acetoacetate--CoA ligase [Bacillus sp. AFS014408]PFW60816.1 acetoacetate--CoA ligase [Bacillus sp. AFS075034]